MHTLNPLLPRDNSDFADGDNHSTASMGHLLFALFAILLLGTLCATTLLCLRRKRLSQEQQQSLLPTHSRSSHHRSASISNFPANGNTESYFVYDEKMNLIQNSSAPPPNSLPEIRVTFPDDDATGENQRGRVVVVHVTDSGSVGMAPLEHEELPPYQKEDAERFESLDLERIGGLREKEPLAPRPS